MKKRYWIICLFLIVSMAGCTAIPSTIGGAPSIPISVNLIVGTFIQPQRLGSEAILTANVAVDPAYGEAKNVTAKFILPDGIEFVSGDLSWNGDLKPNQPISFSTEIKAKQVGNWTIETVVEYILGPGSLYVDRDKSCISVYEDKIIVTSGECPSKIITPFRETIETRERPKSFAPAIPIKVELSISSFFDRPYQPNETKPPPNTSIGKRANLTTTITVDAAYGDAPNTTLNITLPFGFTLVDGNLIWNGDVKANSPVNITNTIEVHDYGDWVIEATAGFPLDATSWFGDTDYLYASVCFREIYVSYTRPTNNWISRWAIPFSQYDDRIYADSFLSANFVNNTIFLMFSVITVNVTGFSKIQIAIPDNGLDLVSGDLAWEGYLEKLDRGEPAERIKNVSSFEIGQILEDLITPNATPPETSYFYKSINATLRPTSSGEGDFIGYVEITDPIDAITGDPITPEGIFARKVVVVHVSAINCGVSYYIKHYKPCDNRDDCFCIGPWDLPDACGMWYDSFECVRGKCRLIPGGALFYCDENIGCKSCKPTTPCVREDIDPFFWWEIGCYGPEDITCECASMKLDSLEYGHCSMKK